MSWDEIRIWLGEHQAEIIGRGLRIVVVLVGVLLLSRLLRKAVARVEGKVQQHTTPIRALRRTQTLAKVLSSAGIVVISAVSGFYILDQVGFNPAPLLAGIGIVGLPSASAPRTWCATWSRGSSSCWRTSSASATS